MNDTDPRPLPMDGKRVVIETDYALISLVPISPGEAPRVEAFVRHERVPIEAHERGDSMRFEVSAVDPRGRPFWHEGPLRVVAHLAPGARVRAHTSAGKIVANGVSGELDLASDAGVIDLESVTGTIRLATSAGRIDGSNLSGSIEAESNAGAVRLEIAHLDPGTHSIQTNLGATRIELARGMPVRVEARTTMGSARVRFPSQHDAAAILSVTADVGAIRVRESSRAWVSPSAIVTAAGPFRTPSPPEHREHDERPGATDEDLEKVLARVASGELSPGDARELLRAMGI